MSDLQAGAHEESQASASVEAQGQAPRELVPAFAAVRENSQSQDLPNDSQAAMTSAASAAQHNGDEQENGADQDNDRRRSSDLVKLFKYI